MRSLLVAILVFTFSCGTYGVCLPDLPCYDHSGMIVQEDQSVIALQQDYTQHRLWHIQPSLLPTNVLLSFKNFVSNTETNVTATWTRSSGQQIIQYYTGKLNNFEIVETNVKNIILSVPMGHQHSVNFTLHYYSGCQMVKDSNIRFPSQYLDPAFPERCWIITSSLEGERKRFYFTFRDISMSAGSQIKLWDVNTDEQIALVNHSNHYKVFAAESTASSTNTIRTFMLSFQSNSTGNAFFASYYTMADSAVECIEVQKLCSWFIDDIPAELCNVSCPAFEQMVEKEYEMEGSIPLVRSGPVKKDQKSHQQMGKKRCPLNSKYCDCPANTDLLLFCNAEMPCFFYGRCTWACIFSQIVTCTTITLLKSIELL